MSEASLPLPSRLAQRPAKLCSDAQLARNAARGDQRAFAEVFERHHQAVYRYCRSILGNEEDAADALQSTMAAVLRGLGGETRQIALKPWLFRIAHNESLTILRRRRPQSELDESAPSPYASVESEVLLSEQLHQMVADVRALPERQRGALVMRELNDLEYSEIAAVFGVAEGAARQAVHEARTMLGELSAGRAIPCADIRELISARDGRLMRGRKVRSHLRACPACEGFHAAIGQRRAGLAAVAPPLGGPLAASILNGLLAGGSAGGAAGTGLAAGAGATAVGSMETAGVAAIAAKAAGGAGILTKSLAALGVTATVAGGTIAIEQRVHAPAKDTQQQKAAPAPAEPGDRLVTRGAAGASAAGASAGGSGAKEAGGAGGSQAGADPAGPAETPDAPAGAQTGGASSALGDLAGEAPDVERETGAATAELPDIEIVDESLDAATGEQGASTPEVPGVTAPAVPQVSVPNTGVTVDPGGLAGHLPPVGVP